MENTYGNESKIKKLQISLYRAWCETLVMPHNTQLYKTSCYWLLCLRDESWLQEGLVGSRLRKEPVN